ncbi:hypothetical protein ABCR94_24950 [Streptomyces sp. 21So2-11]|uniref:hypothetical protein n=1 Tax=Streptomyces sp. 21So2-11 TaxID=3144408 RepID=UPI00321B2C25
MRVKNCQHTLCGAPLPKDADRRTRYCSPAHQRAANRLKHASKRAGTVATFKPVSAPEADAERADELRAVWRLLIDSVTAQGVLVPGSAGAPVSHPALRFIVGIDAALSAHEKTAEPAEEDPLEALQALARRALASG